MEKKNKEKKKKYIISDLIGPTIVFENVLFTIFYFWWNFAVVKKPGIISIIFVYLMVLVAIFLIILSIVGFLRLLWNKEDVSKSVKKEKTDFSVLGMIIGLILLLFTDAMASSIGIFSSPSKECNNPFDIVDESYIGVEDYEK